MDRDTARALNSATAHFYATEHASFAETRKRPWEGWERVLSLLEKEASQTPLALIDAGCGTLRFEHFLAASLPQRAIDAWAIDSCPALAAQCAPDASERGAGALRVHFDCVDICEACDQGAPPLGRAFDQEFDLAVAFGLLHHIPLASWRLSLIEALLGAVRKGGLIALSFWQPLKDERLARQAREKTAEGAEALGIELSLEDGDCLLGWQGKRDIFRFCHHFFDKEVDDLIANLTGADTSRASRAADTPCASCGADTSRASRAAGAAQATCTLVDDYYSDGKSGDLNRTVILKRNID